MGAFYLVCESDPVERSRILESIETSLREQGFGVGQRVASGSVRGCFYGKLGGTEPQVHVTSDGRFAALCGTALVNGTSGIEAARTLLAGDGVQGVPNLVGNYCLATGDPQGVRLFVDPLGVYKVYLTQDLRVFSSSFLAVAAALRGITPDPQGIYEYVHQEAAYGGATIAREIRVADAGGYYLLGDRGHFVESKDSWSPQHQDRSRETHLQACLARLREIYTEIEQCFGNDVDTALSGGYDSRLTLALLRERRVDPSIHVYGSGDSPDVRVARRVAQGEGFHLHHVDKSLLPAPDSENYAAVLRENFLAFDGWPPSGIFDSGADLATRRDRAAGGQLMLNGGGGEIFRNFFYLPQRRFTAMEIVWSFYSRYVAQWCTDEFDETAYLRTLADKITVCVGGGERLSREQVEYIYPAFRCGYWMGRNNSINGRLGWALTPFIDRDLVRMAVGIPLRLKNHGRFEAALIRAVSPALARYPSDYGHAFDREPPLSRVLNDQTTLLRPPWLRRYTYRMRFRKPRPRPKWLQSVMLERVIDPAMPVMSQFFHVERMNDPEAFARMATLEYLFSALSN